MNRFTALLAVLVACVIPSCGDSSFGILKPQEFSGTTTIIVSADEKFTKSGPSFSGPSKRAGEKFPQITWIASKDGVDRMKLEYTAIEPFLIEITEPGYKTHTVVLDSESPSEIRLSLERENPSEQGDDAN